MNVNTLRNSPIAELQPAMEKPVPRVRYSNLSVSETRAPEGMSALSLVSGTGSVLVGGFVTGVQPTEPERLVSASLAYINKVAAALPIDRNDERVVDELLLKKTAQLATRSLRRREGEPR